MNTKQNMKIFQIGFNKCGTTSLYKLFKDYASPKLKCVHWDKGNLAKIILYNIANNIKPVLGKYESFDFISDMEHATTEEIILIYKDYFTTLDKNYPDSKFILNIRPIEKWIQSRINHEQHLHCSYIKKYEKIYNLNFFGVINLWKQHWHEHMSNVQSYFKNKNNLLIFDIENDSLNKLKNFFNNIEFSTQTLPKTNETTNSRHNKAIK